MIAELLVVAATIASFSQAPSKRPFAEGERATYRIRYLFSGGSASLETGRIETVRGRPAWNFMFIMSGGTIGFHMNDTLQSWTDTAKFQTLRFHKHLHDGGSDRENEYEVFPERSVWSDRGKKEQPSVANPLDDLSFLYYIRSLPLRNDTTYSFDNYYKPANNPITLRVIGRERIEVPAGKFNTIVVQPVIKSSSLFSDGAHARLWLADDSTRVIVQIKLKLSKLPGTLTFELKSFRPASLSDPPSRK